MIVMISFAPLAKPISMRRARYTSTKILQLMWSRTVRALQRERAYQLNLTVVLILKEADA